MLVEDAAEDASIILFVFSKLPSICLEIPSISLIIGVRITNFNTISNALTIPIAEAAMLMKESALFPEFSQK